MAAVLGLATEKRPPGVHSCFFPLLPILEHSVPSSSQLCRQAGSAPWGMLNPISAGFVMPSAWGRLLPRCAWQSPVSQGSSRGGSGDSEHGRTPGSRVCLCPLLLWAALRGKLYCFGTGKGKEWRTGLGPVALPSNPRLWHNLLVLLCACSDALCSSKARWRCSGRCWSPTYTQVPWAQAL